MRTAVFATLAAFVTGSIASGKETVTVSKLSIHREGSPVGDTIASISFKLDSADAKGLKCSAKEFPFPEPIKIHGCGKSDYAFSLWPGEDGADFHVMIYHDVGDSYVYMIPSGFYYFVLTYL
jgi:hypothetical protein